MNRFEVGQQVLCIDNTPKPKPHQGSNMNGLTVGEIYTVKSIFINRDNDLIVEVKEIDRFENWPQYRELWADCRGYYAWRFRPLNDSKLDMFRKMCEKEPAWNKLEVIRSEKAASVVFYKFTYPGWTAS